MDRLDAAEPAAQHIGPYDVDRVLGRGSMGLVYLARDRRIGRQVAIKTVHFPESAAADDTSAVEFYSRLQREAELCGSMQHRNVVTLYEAGYENDRISYLVMEYVDGETLLTMIKRVRPAPLPVATATSIAADVLRGLSYAHSKGIIHRDIKPANIFVDREGVAKIGDFGIARPLSSSLTIAGSILGTPSYMSPEQVEARTVSPRSDIFGAGVILFEMLTGMRPFMAPTMEAVLDQVVRAKAPRIVEINAAIPRHLGALVDRMLAKNPEERPTAEEALAILEADSAAGRSTAVEPEAVPRGASSALRRPVRTRTAAVVAGTAALALLIPVLALRSRTPAPSANHISQEQLGEFEQKRRAIAEADMLYESGRFEESAEKYAAYLQKYPHSAAAESGLERSRAALQEEKKDEKKPAARRRPRREPTPLERLKRLFRG